MEQVNGYAVNKHHTLWEKRGYKRSPVQWAMRTHPVLIVPKMDIVIHDSLHQNIDPLPTMSKDLANRSLGFLANQFNITRHDAFEDYITWLDEKAQSVGSVAMEAGMFTEQLEGQNTYIRSSYGKLQS